MSADQVLRNDNHHRTRTHLSTDKYWPDPFMRPRIGRVVASARKSAACTSVRTSRCRIRNSSCFTNDCVAADKPSLRVLYGRSFDLRQVTDRTSFGSSANSLLALIHWKMSASAQNAVPMDLLATNTAAFGSGFFLFRSTSCTRFKIPPMVQIPPK